jgi:hypothetical protein
MSIGTTANNILKLGVENRRSNRKVKRQETVIPTDYIDNALDLPADNMEEE